MALFSKLGTCWCLLKIYWPYNFHKTDWDVISAYNKLQYNIKQTSDESKENNNWGIISWSDTKFSKVTS